MLRAQPGWVAVFQRETSEFEEKLPVVAWDENGHAMVVDEHKGMLTKADRRDDFKCLKDDHSPPIVAIMPADGWRCAITNDGAEEDTPLVGWGLTATGDVVPLGIDDDGYVDISRGFSLPYRIYHPSNSTNPVDGSTSPER